MLVRHRSCSAECKILKPHWNEVFLRGGERRSGVGSTKKAVLRSKALHPFNTDGGGMTTASKLPGARPDQLDAAKLVLNHTCQRRNLRVAKPSVGESVILQTPPLHPYRNSYQS